MNPITFSNPRLSATFDNWPSGGKRVNCTFLVEKGTKSYRFSRTTTGKPKFNTYGGLAAIVDGSNGRTYLLQKSRFYDFIKVSASDFMDAPKDQIGFEAAVFPQHEQYAMLNALIEQANSTSMNVNQGVGSLGPEYR